MQSQQPHMSGAVLDLKTIYHSAMKPWLRSIFPSL